MYLLFDPLTRTQSLLQLVSTSFVNVISEFIFHTFDAIFFKILENYNSFKSYNNKY